MTLTPANVDERDALWDVIEYIQGLLIGDKGFIRPILKQELATLGIDLQTPLRKNMKDERPKSFTICFVIRPLTFCCTRRIPTI